MLFTVDNFFKHCSCLGISFGIEKNLTLECIGAILCDAAFRITASVGREGCDGVIQIFKNEFSYLIGRRTRIQHIGKIF